MVIFFAGLTLSVKLGAIWQDLEFEFFAPAIAESKTATKLETPEQDKNKPNVAAAEHQKMASAANKDVMSDEAAQSGASGEKEHKIVFDPSQVTDAEVEVLQKLAVRRDELDRRSREIDLRDTLLLAMEKRVKAKLGELQKYEAIVQGLLKKHEGEQDAKYRSLVKIYESMKPKNAALIFEELEMDVLLNVVERMRESRTAPILAKMAPKKAKALTMELAARFNLPMLKK